LTGGQFVRLRARAAGLVHLVLTGDHVARLRARAKELAHFARGWLEGKASLIDHDSVAKSVYTEVDISAGYFLILTIANLIALSGLLMNNTAVIVGAMLISPLMGAILSSGFAFITGNRTIGSKALKKIALSVAVTIVIAGAATFVSPMQDMTEEILSRTRPNLFDLVVAFLAGTVGANALCRKKNYLTTVTGVAIATAVIPPLSVAGYGLGTGNFYVGMGGFFLFFTNFVAIIISTGLVFLVYGFRPGMMTDMKAYELKKRLVFLAAVLLVISAPLVYTLREAIKEVRLRSSIQSVLKKEFDRENLSHLSAFTHTAGKDGKIMVAATINTVTYLNESEIVEAEKKASDQTGHPVRLDIEQVLVRSGGLKPPLINPSEAQSIAPVMPAGQKSADSSVAALVGKTAAEIERVAAPSTVAGLYVGLAPGGAPVPVSLKIRKDAPLTADEKKWLARVVSGSMKEPVDLDVEAVPFFEPLVFRSGSTKMTEKATEALKGAKEIYARDPEVVFRVEAYPGSSEKSGRSLASRRAAAVASVLAEEHGVPADRVVKSVKRASRRSPTVKVSVQPKPASSRATESALKD